MLSTSDRRAKVSVAAVGVESHGFKPKNAVARKIKNKQYKTKGKKSKRRRRK